MCSTLHPVAPVALSTRPPRQSVAARLDDLLARVSLPPAARDWLTLAQLAQIADYQIARGVLR